MALLQISEPGQSPDPHQRRIAVGIDLGTTNSLVAAVRHGVAECLPDAQGRVILPSAVRYLGGGRRQIGHDALAAQADDPLDTPLGPVSLNENRQASGTVIINEVQEDGAGGHHNVMVGKVENVTQTLGMTAYEFRAMGLPSRDTPDCNALGGKEG